MQDGIGQVPLLAMMVKYPAGHKFKAKVSLTADVGFSINPRRWSMFARPDDPVVFDEKEPIGETIDCDFDGLDIASFVGV
jgi:hypothetical protein